MPARSLVRSASTGQKPNFQELKSTKMEDLGAQSLMTAMSKFVQAVEHMDDAVMIPSKLRDMDSAEAVTTTPAPPSFTSRILPQNGGLMSSHNGGRTSPPITPPPTKSHALIPTEPADGHSTDLYDFYTMLNAVKHELVAGPQEDVEKEEEESDEQNQLAKKTAKQFRHHLRGLFGVLHQLTDTADAVTSRYQETVGDTNRNYSSIGLMDYY